jgi:hypothetical protein
MPGNKGGTGRFVKGVSGNPNGRPKVPKDVREMLKAATPKAAQLLIDSITDDSVSINYRIDAAKEILNRVYGKPTQPIDGDMDTTLKIILSGETSKYAE